MHRFKMKKTAQVTVRVSSEMYDAISLIADRETRRPNEITRFLIDRGISRYIEDGKLLDDRPPEYSRLTS